MLPTIFFVCLRTWVSYGGSWLLFVDLDVVSCAHSGLPTSSAEFPKTIVTTTRQFADSGHDQKYFSQWLVLVKGHQDVTSSVIPRSDWPGKNGEASQAE